MSNDLNFQYFVTPFTGRWQPPEPSPYTPAARGANDSSSVPVLEEPPTDLPPPPIVNAGAETPGVLAEAAVPRLSAPDTATTRAELHRSYSALDPHGAQYDAESTLSELHSYRNITDSIIGSMDERERIERDYRRVEQSLYQRMTHDLAEDHRRLMWLEASYDSNRETLTDTNF